MRGTVIVKPGVSFAVIRPAGFRLLGAIDVAARHYGVPLMITCGCEAHPPLNPHSLGEAYDVRTHGLAEAQKAGVLQLIMQTLADADVPGDGPVPASGGWATAQFWGWLEHPGEDQEHLHVQRRKGTVYA